MTSRISRRPWIHFRCVTRLINFCHILNPCCNSALRIPPKFSQTWAWFMPRLVSMRLQSSNLWLLQLLIRSLLSRMLSLNSWLLCRFHFKLTKHFGTATFNVGCLTFCWVDTMLLCKTLTMRYSIFVETKPCQCSLWAFPCIVVLIILQ